MNQQADQTLCPLCTVTYSDTRRVDGDVWEVVCRRCGHFQVSDEAKKLCFPYEKDRHLLSGVTREHWERNHKPLLILTKNIEELRCLAPEDRDVQDKARRLLLTLERMTKHPGYSVGCDRHMDYSLAYCRNDEEFGFFTRYLEERGFVRPFGSSSDTWNAAISADGWAAIEAYKTSNIESDKVFVGMWFNEEMDLAYAEGIKPAIEVDCGYRAIKINLEEFVGDIVDEIIGEIRESRFVVADFTKQRQGVYYEAGYARGMGLPVIWTCRKDDIGNLHFDTRQQNHIDWETPEELRERLANRIRAVIGLGPHKGK